MVLLESAQKELLEMVMNENPLCAQLEDDTDKIMAHLLENKLVDELQPDDDSVPPNKFNFPGMRFFKITERGWVTLELIQNEKQAQDREAQDRVDRQRDTHNQKVQYAITTAISLLAIAVSIVTLLIK